MPTTEPLNETVDGPLSPPQLKVAVPAKEPMLAVLIVMLYVPVLGSAAIVKAALVEAGTVQETGTPR